MHTRSAEKRYACCKPDFPEEGMPQGLLGRNAILWVVHQQLLQQILPLGTQVGYQLCDTCPFLHVPHTFSPILVVAYEERKVHEAQMCETWT